jgi:transcriptional regulator with XRE-family HTH domain
VPTSTLTTVPGLSPVAEIWRRSGLRQAELARRAGLPRSVLNAYIWGKRRPRADVLKRVAAGAGMELRLAPRTPPVDGEEAGRRLVQVLELAEALPFRPREKLEFPGLPRGGRVTP